MFCFDTYSKHLLEVAFILAFASNNNRLRIQLVFDDFMQ